MKQFLLLLTCFVLSMEAATAQQRTVIPRRNADGKTAASVGVSGSYGFFKAGASYFGSSEKQSEYGGVLQAFQIKWTIYRVYINPDKVHQKISIVALREKTIWSIHTILRNNCSFVLGA